MNIITPEHDCASTVETGDYVTLTWNEASITLPTLPRPDNYTEVIYLADDGALTFIPGTTRTAVATLASHAGVVTLTLLSLTPAATPAETPANPL
jgi:hypothetical protein